MMLSPFLLFLSLLLHEHKIASGTWFTQCSQILLRPPDLTSGRGCCLCPAVKSNCCLEPHYPDISLILLACCTTFTLILSTLPPSLSPSLHQGPSPHCHILYMHLRYEKKLIPHDKDWGQLLPQTIRVSLMTTSSSPPRHVDPWLPSVDLLPSLDHFLLSFYCFSPSS